MTPRRLLPFLLTSVVLTAVGLSGCVAIQFESATTRLPGVVTINLAICAADRTTAASTCFPSPTPSAVPTGGPRQPNTAEGDNGSDNPTTNSPPAGQLLVGFEVPAGTVTPDQFRTPGGDVFSSNASYTADLVRDHPAPPGFEWHGYSSTKNTLINGQPLTSFGIEFGLPPGPGGAPFSGPFQWLAVIGSRSIGDNADAPVDCSSTPDGIFPPAARSCYDSPPTDIGGAIHASAGQAPKAVSDFRVMPGMGATAAPGQTATLSFPVLYTDHAGFNTQTFKLTGASGLPGGPAVTPSTANLTMTPSATPTTVNETVAVPAGTPPGTYPVTLTAADGATNPVTRENTATLTVVDKTAPAISIGSPTNGEVLTVGQKVAASYSCADETGGSGVASCAGPVPSGGLLDTGAAGQKTFTVTAADKAGNAATLTRNYTVAALQRKTLNVSLSFLFSAGRKSTKFRALSVKGVPEGASVSVTCAGKGCPAKSFKKQHANGSVSLKPYVKKALRKGLRLTVTVSKPGFVSMIKTLTIRPSKAPRIVTTCKAPGAKKASRC
jgi:hypothetical protein